MESQVVLTRAWAWTFHVSPQEGETWPDTKESYQSQFMRPTQLTVSFHAGIDGKISHGSPSVHGMNVKKDGTTGTILRHVKFSQFTPTKWPDYVKRYVFIASAQVEAEVKEMRDALLVLKMNQEDDFGL